MNPTIKNPFAHAKRALARSLRRTRASYPNANVNGPAFFVARAECGENKPIPRLMPRCEWGDAPRMTLLCKFVFRRVSGVRPSRSKYVPHVGNKQLARA
jgi:hypothetical protein